MIYVEKESRKEEIYVYVKMRSLMGGGKDIKLNFSKETRREEDF